MPIRIRPVTTMDDFHDAVGCISHYFGTGRFGEERELERTERLSTLLPFERMHAAFDGRQIVGGAGAFPVELTVPGGPVPCAGVTVVGVLPTHRRRGILRSLMRAQLDDVRSRGEPVAALWASEETIYGRYGYGLASLSAFEMRLPRVWADLVPGVDRGSMRLVSPDEALEVFPRVYERVRRRSVGFLSRSRAWWEERTLRDDAFARRGAGVLQRALLECEGRAAGYALYRIKPEFGSGEHRSEVQVVEAFGDSPPATRAVWRFLLSIDWIGEIFAQLLPLDHSLLHLVARPNRMAWQVADGLWVRLVDVAAALTARSYAGDGRITLELADAFLPENAGTWTIENGVARRTRRRPDVRLDAQALGAVYLGGFTFAGLAAGGRVEEVARGGLARADALFATAMLPWCPETF